MPFSEKIKLSINSLLRKTGLRLVKFDESEYDYREILLQFVKERIDELHGDILEIGATGWNVRDLIQDPQARYTALDTRPAPNIDIVGSVMSLSQDVKNKKFDAIVCVETLEHVTDPKKAVEEIYISLKSGGYLLASTPFFYELHGEEYGDYWRITRQGWKELLKKFTDVQIKSVGIHELKPHHYMVTARKA